MTFRGFILLVFIFFLIPVLLGKVSLGEAKALLRSPTNVTGEQWKNAGKDLIRDAYAFYRESFVSIFQRFRPQIEEKAKEFKIDEALRENKSFIDKGLKLLEPTKE